MTDDPSSSTVPTSNPLQDVQNRKLFFAAHLGSIREIMEALEQGAEINYTNPQTGLCALHVAVGANDFLLVRYLIEECGSAFFPDRFGRWPTLIAAECEVDDELSDYIVQQEARFLKENRSS